MKDTAKPDEAVVIECDLPDAPGKVWRALTEPELVDAWLAPDDEPRSTARDEAERDPVERKQPVEREVLQAEPNRLLRWRQWERDTSSPAVRTVESIVTFELTDLPEGGTHLRIVHDGFKVVLNAGARRATALATTRATAAGSTPIYATLSHWKLAA